MERHQELRLKLQSVLVELKLNYRFHYMLSSNGKRQWYTSYNGRDLTCSVPAFNAKKLYLNVVHKTGEREIFKRLFRYIALYHSYLQCHCFCNKREIVEYCRRLCLVSSDGQSGPRINPRGLICVGEKVVTFDGIRDIKQDELFTRYLLFNDICIKYNERLYDLLIETFFSDDLSFLRRARKKSIVITEDIFEHENVLYVYNEGEVLNSLFPYLWGLSLSKIRRYMSRRSPDEMRLIINNCPIICIIGTTCVVQYSMIEIKATVEFLREILIWLIEKVKYPGKILVYERFFCSSYNPGRSRVDLFLENALKYVRPEQIANLSEPEPLEYLPYKTFAEKILRARRLRYHRELLKCLLEGRVPRDLVNLCLEYI